MQTSTSADLFQLADTLADVALAAPVVATDRIHRLAGNGFMRSVEDRAELARMVDEKGRAFLDAWASIGVQSAVATNLLVNGLAWAGFRPWSATMADWRLGQQALIDAPKKWLQPIHAAVQANAMRLRKARLSHADTTIEKERP